MSARPRLIHLHIIMAATNVVAVKYHAFILGRASQFLIWEIEKSSEEADESLIEHI